MVVKLPCLIWFQSCKNIIYIHMPQIFNIWVFSILMQKNVLKSFHFVPKPELSGWVLIRGKWALTRITFDRKTLVACHWSELNFSVLKVLRFYLTRITFDRKKPSGMSVGRISQFCHFWGFHSWCLVWTDWEKVQVEIGIISALWDVSQCQRKLVAKEEAESESVIRIFMIITDAFLVPLYLYSKLYILALNSRSRYSLS